jgi:putative phosphoesterase
LSDEFSLTPQRSFAAPLTIGVISDTHIFAGGRRRLPLEITDLFRRFGCGLLLHAGDVNTPHTLAELARIAPVLAVTGNNDDAEMRRIAPRELTFEVGRFKFAMLHGDGGASARSEARKRFAGRADLVIYGHSHIPISEMVDGSVLFNPGSATDRRWQEHFGIGLISVSEERCVPEIVLFNDPRELNNVKPD